MTRGGGVDGGGKHRKQVLQDQEGGGSWTLREDAGMNREMACCDVSPNFYPKISYGIL